LPNDASVRSIRIAALHVRDPRERLLFVLTKQRALASALSYEFRWRAARAGQRSILVQRRQNANKRVLPP